MPKNGFAIGKVNGALLKGLAAGLLLMGLAACASPEEKVEKYTKSGQEYLAEGKPGIANIEFQNALKINEEHIPALEGLAAVAEKNQKYERLFGILQRIVRVDPANSAGHVKLGQLYLIGSDESAALESAENALALNTQDADALALKAAIFLKTERTSEALEIAREALAIDPASAEAVTVIAAEMTREKNYEGALTAVEQVLAHDEKVPVLQLLRLQILSTLGREDDVDRGFEHLTVLFPGESAYYRIHARTLIAKENFESAREKLAEIVKLEPENLDAKLDVVRVDFKIGGLERAVAGFNEFIAANPEDQDLKFAYAAFMRQQQDFAAAEEVYQTAVASKDEALSNRGKGELAALRLAEGKPEDAQTLLDEVLEADSSNTEALVRRASLKIADKRFDDAIADLRLALQNEPDSAAAMLLMGAAFEEKGDTSLAESQMSQAAEAGKDDPRIANHFARFLRRHGDTDRAEKIIEESLAAHPNSVENLRLLASIRLNNEDWRGAEETAKVLQVVSSSDPAVSRILGAAYAGLEDYDSAINALTNVDNSTRMADMPLASLVSAYLKSDRTDEAENLLREVVASGDKKYSGHLLLAQVHAARQEFDQAEKSLLDAVAIDPSRTEAYDVLYRYYLRIGEADRAKGIIDRGIEGAPENTGLRVFKADVLMGEENYEGALAEYEALLKLRPADRLVANNYVSLTTELRNDPESLAHALEVAEILKGEENAYFKDTLGWAFYKNGQYRDAVRVLRGAVEGAPSLADARYHLGASYAALDRTVDAQEQLTKALEIGGANFKYEQAVRDLLAGL